LLPVLYTAKKLLFFYIVRHGFKVAKRANNPLHESLERSQSSWALKQKDRIQYWEELDKARLDVHLAAYPRYETSL
jgi:hypothetical protein